MEKLVAEMTQSELRTLVGDLVEEKLLEALKDTDAGLELRESVRQRLETQQQQVAEGERGQPFTDALSELGLT